ncbi:hypothetical protein YYG_04507 [Plasmodium vinckei petteri]|uniref:Uncharacterized protein n=3 Tax=Plasmodium vinckei TaxID=5860 RepID=W7AXM7_PLAVN|nr:hypothetical protein YYG_04507 [Plasmodium vinckei petteri]
MLNRTYRFLIEDIGMVNILLVCLLGIAKIRKILCNIIIVVNLYYEKGVKEKFEKWKNKIFFPFISCSLSIGEHYKGEALSKIAKLSLVFVNIFAISTIIKVQENSIFIHEWDTYNLTYDYLNVKVFPGLIFLVLSKLILSIALYGGYCAYFIQNSKDKKQNRTKIIIATFLFFSYNIYNFFLKEHNTGNINDLIIVELLTVVLSFILPLFILIEILRKNYENAFNSNNWLNLFFTRFIDDRDRHGLILTHIYLLAGGFICCFFFFCTTFLSLLFFSYLQMAYIKVPSDITILEHTYSKNNKKKKIFFLKKLFIRCSFFTIGNKCSKLNSSDVIKVLSNVYSGDASSNPNINTASILDILNTRQKDIEKQVKCKMYSFVGSILLPLYSLRMFKYYDIKSKAIMVPFFSIMGMYFGSFTGNLVTGRFNDYKRSKFLGTLPANVYLKE